MGFVFPISGVVRRSAWVSNPPCRYRVERDETNSDVQDDPNSDIRGETNSEIRDDPIYDNNDEDDY